jgi:membrane protease YdiL (CAAX protease family)
MQLIASRHGIWIAVVANSALFALAHAGNIEPSNELYVGLANVVLFGLFMAAIGVFIGGGAIMVAGPFAGFPGGPVAAILAGLGLMAGSTTLGALTAILTIWLINGVVWFARLHYRLLKPALESRPVADSKI